MKGCIPEANLEWQGWWKTLFTSLFVLTCGFRYFWKWGNIRKRVRWNRRVVQYSLHFVLGLHENSMYIHFTLMLQLRYDSMVQSLYKSWLLVSKITWKIWATSDKQWKVQKGEIWWLFSKKYIPSSKILHTEDLSNITFNYLCENLPNYLCHFWNHQSFFTTQLLCIFLAQTLHTFCKSRPSKCKFSDFPLLRWKFTKFLISFFK